MARRTSSYRKKETPLGRFVGIGAIIALVAGGVFLVRSQKIPALSGGFSDIGKIGGEIVNAPVNLVRSGVDYVGSIFTNAEEVRKLRAENKALLEWRDSARAIAEKLETYEKLNNITSLTPSKMLVGRLVAETNGPFAKSAIVNIGANQGVAANWIVVNQFGLVGRVVSVGKDSSRVLLLTDGDSRIPVMGETTRGRAILVGDKTDAPSLEHLNIPALIQANERVLTSGDDGIIPRGVAVGQAAIGPDGKWRVKLAINSGAIDYVKLIAPNYIPSPSDKTNGYVIGQGMAPNANAPLNAPNAGGAILPLDAGAAAIPSEQTPQAIAQAQELRKLKAELDNAKKKQGASNSPTGTQTGNVVSAKPPEGFKVKVIDNNVEQKSETGQNEAPKTANPENVQQ